MLAIKPVSEVRYKRVIRCSGYGVFGKVHGTHHCYNDYITVIRGLAVGSITDTNTKSYLKRELKMGTCLSFILGTAGCIRAAIFMTPMLETFAITTSLFMIVSISIILGALLPLGMKKIRIDPAHSSTTIQVIMDILGVTITVFVCRWVYWLSGSILMDD
jgi:Mg/Co/Ni transporter MgtE